MKFFKKNIMLMGITLFILITFSISAQSQVSSNWSNVESITVRIDGDIDLVISNLPNLTLKIDQSAQYPKTLLSIVYQAQALKKEVMVRYIPSAFNYVYAITIRE